MLSEAEIIADLRSRLAAAEKERDEIQQALLRVRLDQWKANTFDRIVAMLGTYIEHEGCHDPRGIKVDPKVETILYYVKKLATSEADARTLAGEVEAWREWCTCSCRHSPCPVCSTGAATDASGALARWRPA